MSLDHTKDGCFYFKFEHNKEYRQIQFTFWDAVSSMNPANIVVSLKFKIVLFSKLVLNNLLLIWCFRLLSICTRTTSTR